MAYTLGSKCAKNLYKRTVLLQLIIKNACGHMFLEHSVCVCLVPFQRYSTPNNGTPLKAWLEVIQAGPYSLLITVGGRFP